MRYVRAVAFAALIIVMGASASAVPGDPVPVLAGSADGSLAIEAHSASPSTALPLETFVDHVLREAPVRRAAAATVAGAREAAPLASRVPNPVIELSQENWRFGSGQDRRLPLDGFVVVTQPVELGGKRGARRGLAEARRDAAEAAEADVVRDLALLAADRYLEAVRLREWVATLAEERDSLAELTEIMRRRFEEGTAAEADFRKLQAETTRVDADLLRAELGLDAALLTLSALYGGEAPIEPAQLSLPAPLPVPPFVDEAAIETAVEQAPAVMVARAATTEAARQVILERAARVPDLLVSGGYKRTDGVNTGVVGVAVPVPLSDRNGVAIARAQAELRAAEWRLEAARREARAHLQTTLRAARSLASRMTRSPADLVEPADIARHAARATFREGDSDVVRLVDAERVWVIARGDALALALDAVSATIRARLALGASLIP